MLRKALITIAALLPVSNVLSAGLDLKLSSETAEVTFLTQSATFGYGGADIGIGLFINENDDFLVNGSIVVSGSGLDMPVGVEQLFNPFDLGAPSQEA